LLRGLARYAGYPLHSPVAPSLPLPRVAVCHAILIVLHTTDGDSRRVSGPEDTERINCYQTSHGRFVSSNLVSETGNRHATENTCVVDGS
jgi:hypothetical protein